MNVHVGIYVCILIYTSVSIQIHIHKNMCIYIYIYVYIHTHNLEYIVSIIYIIGQLNRKDKSFIYSKILQENRNHNLYLVIISFKTELIKLKRCSLLRHLGVKFVRNPTSNGNWHKPENWCLLKFLCTQVISSAPA